MPDQEVKVGLSIEESGEPDAFEDAAKAIQSLTSSAGGAEPSLESLVAALEGLGAAAEGPKEAKQAVADFAGALRELAGATGIDQQREAVDKAVEAWRRLGEEVPEVLDKSSEAAQGYQASLESLTELQSRLADPLTQSLGKAEEAYGKLEKAVEGSMDGAGEKLAQTRRRIDEYREALEAARQAGAGVTGDQVEQLERLEAEYDKAEKKVAQYAATKRNVAKDVEAAAAATSLEGRSINSLGDIASVASPKMGQLVGVAQQIVGAFKAGYEAGSILRDLLNDLTDGAFDRQIQAMLHLQSLADKLVDGLHGVGRAEEELANQRNLFEKLGLAGFTQDVEKNAAVLAAHAQKVRASKGEVEGLKAEVDKLSVSLGVSREKLDEQAESLVRTAAAFAEQNAQLSKTDLAQIFGQQIQAILDAYAKLKIEAPQALASLAAAWGVTTSAVQSATERHKSLVDKLTEQITGISKKSASELAEMTKAIEETFSKINIAGLNQEQLARAKAQVQALIDAYTQAGQQIPDSLARIGTSVGAFQSQADLMTQKCNDAALAVTSVGSATEATRTKTVEHTGSLEEHNAVIQTVEESHVRWTRSLKDGRITIESVGTATKKSGEDIKAGTEAGARGTEELGKAGEKIKDLGTNAEGAGEKVEAAGKQIELLASHVTELSKAPVDLAKPVAEVESLKKAAEGAAKGVKDLVTELAALKTAGSSALGSLLSQLDQVTTKAKEAAEAVKKVTTG
jgi:chromosome segregation ATPase